MRHILYGAYKLCIVVDAAADFDSFLAACCSGSPLARKHNSPLVVLPVIGFAAAPLEGLAVVVRLLEPPGGLLDLHDYLVADLVAGGAVLRYGRTQQVARRV